MAHLTNAKRNHLQVAAFKAFYKSTEGIVEERFARAIVTTSDDAFENINEAKLEQWLKQHGDKETK